MGKYTNLIASYGLKAPQLLAKIRQTDRMVEDPVSSVVVGIGTSDDANQRQILAVRTGDRIEDAEPTDGESDDARTDAPGSSVAIGGVPSIEFVAAADVVERRLGDEVVKEGEVEVARNGEDIGDADLHEPASEVATQSGLGRVDHGGGDRVVLDCGHSAIREATHVVAGWLAGVNGPNLGVHGSLD